jgi:hypothetical protein
MKAADGRIEFATLLVAAPGGNVSLRVPREVSSVLGKPGRVELKGSINGKPLKALAAPDGAGGHAASFTQAQLNVLGLRPGDKVRVVLEPSTTEAPVEVPADLLKALGRNVNAKPVWDKFQLAQRRAWVAWLDLARPVDRERKVAEAVGRIALGKLP